MYVGNNPIRVIDADGRYGIDVHYDLTYYMSVAVMGVSNEIAGIIASADQGVDDSFWNSSINPVSWFNSLHFSSSKSIGRIKSLLNNPMALSNEDFGAYLHSFQDVPFAHFGYSAVGSKGFLGLGHLFINGVDDVTDNNGKLKNSTIAMIIALYKVMKDRNGGKANIRLSELIKTLNNYVSENPNRGFANIQSIAGGETRNNNEEDATDGNKKVRSEQAERWRNYDPQYQ